MDHVTQILAAIQDGDAHAAEQLLPLVYQELRRLAAEKMAQERPGQTLEATGLVHEAYLRLVDVQRAQHWNSRGHFFAAAAEAMRRILVENARRKRSLKRGGDYQRVNLDESLTYAQEPPDDLLALSEALDLLARESFLPEPRHERQVVRLVPCAQCGVDDHTERGAGAVQEERWTRPHLSDE